MSLPTTNNYAEHVDLTNWPISVNTVLLYQLKIITMAYGTCMWGMRKLTIEQTLLTVACIDCDINNNNHQYQCAKRTKNKQNTRHHSHKLSASRLHHSAASRPPRRTYAKMIDYVRPYEQNMCELYFAQPTAAARLDDFQVFRKGTASHIYGNYYSAPSYEAYTEPEIDNAANVYHNLVSCREYHRDDWRYKIVLDWSEDDTVSWFIDTVQCMGISEYNVPFHNFRVCGMDLRNMKREELIQRMSHPNIDPESSRNLGEVIFEKLHSKINEDMLRQSSIFRYAESDPYQHNEQTVLDLDSLDHKNRLYPSDYKPNDSSLLAHCDSSDDAEDVFRSSETASPECSYGSDGSKSGDEDDKRKMFKRPPGRPKGSGRKTFKRPRSVSVPEFLRNLLLDPNFCPSIIKWEDHCTGKFRFVKPDEVAKLWGKMKQNDHMTFEKFSRAMRYHYKQSVLVSVPTARLVYQFGNKGPDFKTDNPNFVKVKTEFDMNDIHS